VFINEALAHQRIFNGHVRESYAQLSAEVLRLRRRVEELEAAATPAQKPKPKPKPKPKVPTGGKKAEGARPGLRRPRSP
jgi:hypothetical protein